MRPISDEANRGKPHLTSGTSKRSFTPLQQLKSSPTYPSLLERKHENPAHIQRSPISGSELERRDPFPRVRKEFPVFPSHLKRRRSPQERRDELQGLATIPRVPQMSQSIPGKTVFPELPRLSSRGSTHTTVARGKALWESLVGKPRGKATDPLIHAKGRATQLPQLGRKAHVHTRLETRTDSPGETQKYPKIHVSTGEEFSGSGTEATQGLKPA